MMRETRLGIVAIALGGGSVMAGLLVAAEGLLGLSQSTDFCLVIVLVDPALILIMLAFGALCLSYGAYRLGGQRFASPRGTLPSVRLRQSALVPPRRGATLISVLAAMAIIAICLTLVLQAYLQGARFVELQQRRSQAAAACQAQIEQARARGYAALPVPGEHTFDAGEDLAGMLLVEVGPRENARTITARVSWERNDAMPGGQVELVTIMTPRGIGGS